MTQQIEINIDELLAHIVENLPKNAAIDDPKGGNKSWTLHLKRLLENFGALHYRLSSEYSDPSRHMSEFLIDFQWWDKRIESRQQMVLAVESEWYNLPAWVKDPGARYAEDVAADFYKLMVIKSPYKLMTFSSDGGVNRELIVKRLERDTASFVGHVKGERYILLDSSPNDDWGAYELLITEDGACAGHFLKREILSRGLSG